MSELLGELVLPGVPRSVPLARRCLREILVAAGLDVANALLVVSELVSNAVVHTASGLPGGVVSLDVTLVGEAVRLEVSDDGPPGVPRPRESDEDCHGRGLWLVESVSEEWGMRLLGGGRHLVWAEMLIEPARCEVAR